MNRSSRLGVSLVSLFLFCAGCPSPVVPLKSPEVVLKEYSAALERGDFDTAYSMMSVSFRKRVDKKEFLKLVQENAADAKSLAAQLKGKAKQMEVEAKLELSESESFKLTFENGEWRISTNPLDFYGQRTPEEALRSFVRALEKRRYDIVMKFVPAKWAESMTIDKLRQEWEGPKREEVGALLKTLKANLSAPIHQSGDKATMPYGEKFEVRFLCEDGIWKIEDPD